VGRAAIEGDNEDEKSTVFSFAERWAAGTLRQADRLRTAKKQANLLSWQYDRGESWSPDEAQLHQGYQDAWVEQHLLVVAGHQFIKWATRLATFGGTIVTPDVHVHLEALRNSLEHLDEALMDGDYAVPDPGNRRKNWALTQLAGGGLFLGSDWRGPGLTAFGVLDVEALERVCRVVISDIFDERAAPAIDAYIQSQIDEARGK
jgi:hypothetical protein